MIQSIVQHEQWLLLAFMVGAAVMILQILGTMALWRPRKPPSRKEPPAGLHHIPWVLIVTYTGIILAELIYITYHVFVPPNW